MSPTDDMLARIKEHFERQARELPPRDAKYRLGGLIGLSLGMQEVFRLIERIAPQDSTVLLYGLSGTGKELAAHAIHEYSRRRAKPFVAIDCVALSKTLLESELFGHVKGAFTGALLTKPGLLEAAHGGTVFLDEISNMDLEIQAKLLRVLQEREFYPVGGVKAKKVDVRVIAATNKDLLLRIKEGSFREDLYYRLNIVNIVLPPLKERREDIPLLAYYFLGKHGRAMDKEVEEITPAALEKLEAHAWPGNVRELENIVERALVMAEGREIRPEHLLLHPTEKVPPLPQIIPRSNRELKAAKKTAREQAIQQLERAFLLEALNRNHWNISRAAGEVGMKRQNFQALMRKYHILKVVTP